MKFTYLFLVLLFAGCQSATCGNACNSRRSCQPCNEPFYCRNINECHARLLARFHAKRTLWGCGPISSDYKHGYEQAFVDISMGASGEVPPLAPINYWHDHNRSPLGHSQAQDWFAGYAAGSSLAQELRGGYNEVAASMDPGYQHKFAHSLAPDSLAPDCQSSE